jgi:hypothetical protein
MSFKLIAQFETRGSGEPKFRKEIARKILKYLMESRRVRSLKEISNHIGQSEGETKTYLDILERQKFESAQPMMIARIKFSSRGGTDGYVFERDTPAA